MSGPAVEAENTGSKIVLHHLNNSRSQRILWLLEELEIPYEIRKYERTAEGAAPSEMKKIHALGLAPILTDGSLVIAESGAIIEYLITKYGQDKMKPTGASWLDNLYFSHYAEGTLMPLLVNKILFTIISKRTPFFIRPIANLIFGAVIKNFVDVRLKEHNEFVETHLAKSQTGWIANGEHPTSGDFQMSFALESLEAGYPDCGPKIREYLNKVHERPAYKRALEKGGPYTLSNS